MEHRHLDVEPGTPVSELGLAALDDLLERGDLDDWQPLLAEVRRDPGGVVAERILRLVQSHRMGGTSELWRSWIENRRARSRDEHVGARLKALRRMRGLTQQDVADRLGMKQPEVSRLERRSDARLSLVRAYARALGAELELSARFDDETVPLDGGTQPGHTW
jgi:DNA-binding XRE family transcriptional regulator